MTTPPLSRTSTRTASFSHRAALFASVLLPALALSCGPTPLRPAPPPPLPPLEGTRTSALVPAGASSAAAAAEQAAALVPPPLTSDEGMWLLNDFPSDRLANLHGINPDAAFLKHVQLSAVRVNGCSGSFVSPRGLVMTNHHCAHRCIQQLSTAARDYVESGFYAKTDKDEVKCPEIEVVQLVSISDVTDRLAGATAGKAGAAFGDAQKAEIAKIEKACATSAAKRCDVVSLYHGGRYHLYEYQRYQDVRLVFAPEFKIAFFGGDPDNFNFPRYDLDVAFLRVYEGDKPLAAENYFAWSPAGVKDGDITFVAGHPHSTSRELTVSELAFQRDVALPARLLRLAETRGLLLEFQKRGPEENRISKDTLFGIENAMKALEGRVEALRDPDVFGKKVAAQKELVSRVRGNAAWKQAYGGAWSSIEGAETKLRDITKPYTMIEQGAGFASDLFDHARHLVRAADELPKANDARLREYTDAQLPGLTQRIFSTAPIYDSLEIALLAHSLTELRAELGPDDPFVKKVLGPNSPEEVATRLVKGTKLKDPKVRRALFEGKKDAIDASKDPMIAFARLVDPDARAVRKTYEDEVESVVKKNAELVAKARFAAYGTSAYPDATGTLRLSFGQVRGWEEAGKQVAPITDFGGAFERATGRDPFALPKSWLAAKAKLNLATPLNFASTNDIIGGNSGSPVIDREGRIVGLIFDGNIHSLGGDYAYDPKDNRAVAVHSAALPEALTKIYGADRVTRELVIKQ